MHKSAPLVLAAVVALAVPPAGAATRWIGVWEASVTAPVAAGPGVPAARVSMSLTNQTVVETVRLSAGGVRLRLRLTNEFGQMPLNIGAARVAIIDVDGAPRLGSSRAVTFGGSTFAFIPPGAPLISDAIDLKAADLARLEVRLYLPGDTGPCTCHPVGAATTQISSPGDFTDRDFTPVATSRARMFLSGVEAETARRGPVIVAFGDSITDGVASTPDADHRWPDRLADRLASGAAWASAVVDAGISGNHLLGEGGNPASGPSAMARFDRDVLSVPGVTHVIVLEGVNDLGAGGAHPPAAARMIDAYGQLIARAHAHGLTVIGATILPYEGALYYLPEGEAVREAVNAWIRHGGAFDAVVDLDGAMRDPARPGRLRADLQSGDWLQPNDAGYQAVANAFDLRLFRRWGGR